MEIQHSQRHKKKEKRFDSRRSKRHSRGRDCQTEGASMGSFRGGWIVQDEIARMIACVSRVIANNGFVRGSHSMS